MSQGLTVQEAQELSKMLQEGLIPAEQQDQAFAALEAFDANQPPPPTPDEQAQLDALGIKGGGVPIAQNTKGILEQIGDGLKEAVTGDQRNPEGIGEFSGIGGPKLLSDALNFATTDEERADILTQLAPELPLKLDDKGQLLVDAQDGNGFQFVNQPGLSFRDAGEFGAQAALFFPASKAANIIGKSQAGSGALATAGRALGRGALSAGALGGTELGRQKVLDALSDDVRDIDGFQAALVAATGLAGEVIGPIIGAATRAVRNPFLIKDNTLTERGRKAFEDIGIDPELVDGNSQILDILRNSSSPTFKGAAREAVGQGRGAAASGATGAVVSEELTGNAASQSAAGQVVRESVRDAESAARATRDDAFVAARERVAELRTNSLEDTATESLTKLRTDAFNVSEGSPAGKAAKDFRITVLENPNNEVGGILVNTLDNPGSLSRVDQFTRRQRAEVRRLRDKSNADNSDTDAKAIETFVNDIQDNVVEQVNTGLITGDAAKAVDALKDANITGKAFADQFKGNKAVTEIIKNKELTSEETINLILGAQRIPGAKKGAAATLNRVVDIVGKESDAFAALQDQYIQRIFRAGSSEGILQPSAFRAAWLEARREQSIRKVFLDDAQVRALDKIAATAEPRSLIRLAGDILTIRSGVGGGAVAGALRRAGGLDQPLPAAQRAVLSGPLEAAGAAAANQTANQPAQIEQTQGQ